MAADDRLAEIRETHPGSWYSEEWTTRYVDSDGDEPAYYAIRSGGHTIATLPDWAGGLATFMAAAHTDIPFLLGELQTRLAELEIAERQNRDLDAKLTERTQQLNGLLALLAIDEKAVPA